MKPKGRDTGKRGAGLKVKTKNKGGRPKGFDKVEAHDRLRALVLGRMDRMTEAQIAAAEGVSYLMAREKKGGKFVPLTAAMAMAIVSGKDKEHEAVEVWEKPPSTPAYAYLMDQTIGKAKDVQDINLTGTVDIAERLAAGRKRAKAKP